MRGLAKTTIIAVALSAATAAPCAAATFSAPATVVHSKAASRFAIAVNDSGEQAIAWETTHQVSPAPRYREVSFITARTRSAAGVLHRTDRIDGGRGGIWPDVAIARDGTAIVVWSRVVRGHFRIFAAVRRKGRGFGPGREIGRTDKQLGAVPEVEFDSQGNALVVWRWSDRLQYVFRGRGHGFGSARTIRVGRASLHVPIEEKHFAFDRQRNAYLVLASSGKRRRASGGTLETVVPGGIFLSVRKRGAALFGSPRRTSPAGEPASHPRVAAGAPGEQIVAWRGSPTPTSEEHPGPVLAAIVTNGRPGPPQTLTAPGTSVVPAPALSAGPQGEATVAWAAAAAPTIGPLIGQVAASTRLNGGSFGPPILLSSPGGSADFPFVSVTDRGSVVALWREQPPGGLGALFAAALPPGGGFAPGTSVARPASVPTYASAGNRVAALFSSTFPAFQVVTGLD